MRALLKDIEAIAPLTRFGRVARIEGLAVEVTDGRSMRRLDWSVLRQQAGAAEVAYSFRYFQQVEGDIVLPRGVKPVRVIARLLPASGAAVEQSFTWGEATAPAGAGGG